MHHSKTAENKYPPLNIHPIFILLTLYSTDTHFDASTTTAFENIGGKEEIARNEQFLLFPQCFLVDQKIVSPFINIFDIIFLFATELEEPKVGISGKKVNRLHKPATAHIIHVFPLFR